MSYRPLVLVYARRDEPQWLVNELRANTAWVDEVVEVDNRSRVGDAGEGWQHEGRTRRLMRSMVTAVAGGPAWFLQLDPDERLEDTAKIEVKTAIERPGAEGTLFGFPLREMWTPTAYRVDGDWGRKQPRMRLFLLDPDRPQRFADKAIHCGVAPRDAMRRVRLNTWLYHLKNIEPSNRVSRADAYYAADPTFRCQRKEGAGHGRRAWDWLHDETGLELVEISPGRRFTPPYARPYLFTAPGKHREGRQHD